MKASERDLLTKLRTLKVHDPVENVRNSLGAVKHVVGNPMMKAEIQISITSHFFNLGGVPIEILPAALPAALQTSLPIFLLGLTDFYSGYLRFRNILPIIGTWFYAFVPGVNDIGIWGYNKIGGIIPVPILGDMILSFQAVVAGVIYEADIIIHCNNVAYGTFLNSFVSDLITINRLRYMVPIANINQFINPLIFANQTLFGKTDSDSIDPRLYIVPTQFQQQIADIPLNLPITKSVMLGFQLDVFCQQVNLVMFVNKVEPLTHRQTKIVRS
jgi:hypothetical protein